ncbi:Uncharacterized protein TCM_031809 [Theobroma cacao]|uniref:RNase H type-1 domain-containing protein n=1 Tax=Theobroma cacao TaxID=3641 RepID=A0A061FFP0_THECC|nr:Uncharacterized protein TCM_031809 [Theobroma cacao]
MSYNRLDRFLLLIKIMEAYHIIQQLCLPRSISDHNPVALTMEEKNWGPKPFHLFNHWLDKDTFQPMFERAWKEATIVRGCRDKISVDLKQKFTILSWNSKIMETSEIWNSIINCDSSRAPGPGGFSMGFFKKQWKTLKGEIMKIVKDFYHTASLDSKIVSKPKINFQKSCLYGISLDHEITMDWASKIASKANQWPTTYLGLPLGTTTNSIKMWKSIVDKVEARLSSELRIQRHFLWGGTIERRKIHYVSWESTCLYHDLDQVLHRDFQDKLIWKHSTSGIYNSKEISDKTRAGSQRRYQIKGHVLPTVQNSGSHGEARIRGVLTDKKGSIFLLFSMSMGVMDSNTTELLALSKGFQVMATSKWANSHRVVFESDSSNLVSWVRSTHNIPWKHRRIIMKIEGLKVKLSMWNITKVPLYLYEMAVSLAKTGIRRQGDLMWIIGNVCEKQATEES